MKPVYCFFLAAVAQFGTAETAMADLGDVTKIAAEILAARRGITSGQLDIQFDASQGKARVHQDITVWFDGAKRREDCKIDSYTETKCIGETTFIQYTNQALADGGGHAVSM